MEQIVEHRLQTSLGVLTIEQAKPDELRLVIDIVDEAAAWLFAKGITEQWPSPTPKRFAEFMEKQIARGDVYVARIDGDAHLEAGIVGGRAYIAAYALDRGATGLTFYDDDTTKFFEPHATGKSPLLMVAVGVPRSRASAKS